MIAHALLLRPSDSIPVQFPHRHRIPKQRPIPAADDVRVQCRSDCRGTRGNSAREREREREGTEVTTYDYDYDYDYTFCSSIATQHKQGNGGRGGRG